MKSFIFLFLCSFLLASCLEKKDSKEGEQEEERQDIPNQEMLAQEAQKPDVSYVFDIDSFKYLDEFPRTIAGIKTIYPDEPFEERAFETNVKGMGDYAYSVRSPNIWFGFWGDTIEAADLKTVEIFNPDYQCKSMQVIGMAVNDLEKISDEKLKPDGNIKIYTERYFLSIRTKDGIVQNYLIMEL